MNRIVSFIIGMMMALTSHAFTFHSVNYDPVTSAAMFASYVTETATEKLNNESVQKILDHYVSAEVATAGIFASKWFDRKALKNEGLFGNAEENFYYKRIYMMVSTKIMPKILDVAVLLIKYPEKALYWGPYLFKICNQTKQLCMIFQTVVGNNKPRFDDIVFLTIADNLQSLFDLAKLGDVDWRQVWDDLVNFTTGITKEDLMEDLGRLMDAGSAIASAGGSILDEAWTNSSKVGDIFHDKPQEIMDVFDDFKDMYETFSDPMNIKDLVMDQIQSTDSTGVANLFKVDSYNITSYVSDYLHEVTGQYYTQRWYIYYRDSGREHICSYSPPLGSYAITNGPEWYRVTTRDPYYVYNSNDYENSLRNSERYAGWSRSQCQSLNNNEENCTYEFSNQISWSRIVGSRSGTVIGYAYAHYIDVYKTWDNYGEVYEELFDSQYDAVEAIQARFNAKLKELNCNEEGKQYYLGLGTKHYYSAADEAKMNGCAAVTFQMECDENTELAEGNFSWKENSSHNHGINQQSHQLAMESTLGEDPDYSTVDELIQEWSDQVSSLQSQVDVLEQRNNDLLAQISESSIEEGVALRAQYDANRRQIASLTPQLENAKSNLRTYQDLKQEMVDDYADELDGVYRIPACMHELQSGFNLTWTDEGSWQGDTFVRHATMPNVEGVLTFSASLSMERREKHVWLIGRIHRAILAVHWNLSGDYSTNSIVETMELDNSLSDSEKADQINQRLRELMEANPGCSIEPNYSYSSPEEVSGDDDEIHLLWISDRLAIARDVDYRISKIYAQLVLLEKFMRTRETLLDYMKEALGIYIVDGTRRTRIGNKSFRRWRRSATAVALGESVEDVLAEDDDDY